jgi:uncharacterized DUF497 family protein
VSEVHFNNAVVFPDTRKEYGETRYIALCYLEQRLHVLCFTETEKGIRVVSFRKANEREARRYEEKLGVRGPQKAPTKERITIRLSREVVERFRESGDGWQTRVDAALREWLKKHSPA